MAAKLRAFKTTYVSQNQLSIEGFETPFGKELDPNNRWVRLSKNIPWDMLVSIYHQKTKTGGRPPINGRVVIGAMIIKHFCDFSDRETIQHIRENIYMQYFLGYSTFSKEAPFDATLFVEIRERLGLDGVTSMNEALCQHLGVIPSKEELLGKKKTKQFTKKGKADDEHKGSDPASNKGKLIIDATACPQDIAYPTDLNLLSEAREISEKIIDVLFDKDLHGEIKPRTYRRIARKKYLNVAKKKKPSRALIRKGIRNQLGYVKRNFAHIDSMLDAYGEKIPLENLGNKVYKSLLVIHTLYTQQKHMYDSKTHSVEDRIVSIHQPHVRPIVRGKTKAPTEFGAKINISMLNGYTFLDELSWNAFNEGSHLVAYLKSFKERMGHYPKQVLADGIYCNRENRLFCKEHHIKLSGKPLGRPPKDTSKRIKLRPGDRNPVEGKFGQAKTAYGMDRIRARLKVTSETWIAMILLVVNLVKSTRGLSYWVNNWNQTFSALLNGYWADNLAPNENWLGEYALQANFRQLVYLKYHWPN